MPQIHDLLIGSDFSSSEIEEIIFALMLEVLRVILGFYATLNQFELIRINNYR